ncbi:MAG: hypothetical protein ACW99A_12540 [Candidatus Kariarchaeaceae archaeon]|jgi:hypothetical protein
MVSILNEYSIHIGAIILLFGFIFYANYFIKYGLKIFINWKARNWSSIPAKVIRSSIEAIQITEKPYEILNVQFSYFIDKEYNGQYQFAPQKKGKTKINEYLPETSITVYYDPKIHGNSTLQRGLEGSDKQMIYVTLIYFPFLFIFDKVLFMIGTLMILFMGIFLNYARKDIMSRQST